MNRAKKYQRVICEDVEYYLIDIIDIYEGNYRKLHCNLLLEDVDGNLSHRSSVKVEILEKPESLRTCKIHHKWKYDDTVTVECGYLYKTLKFKNKNFELNRLYAIIGVVNQIKDYNFLQFRIEPISKVIMDVNTRMEKIEQINKLCKG